MGLEPTTATLATWRSTTELHPHPRSNAVSARPLHLEEIISAGSAFLQEARRNNLRLDGRSQRGCGKLSWRAWGQLVKIDKAPSPNRGPCHGPHAEAVPRRVHRALARSGRADARPGRRRD